MAIAHVIAAAISAAAGVAVAPWLGADARTLLLAVALLAAGVAGSLPQGRAGLPERGALRCVVLIGLTLTDRATFITFALASGGAAPVLTALGAAIGSVAATTLALSDPAVARRLPRLGRIAAALLLLAGMSAVLRALRLVP